MKKNFLFGILCILFLNVQGQVSFKSSVPVLSRTPIDLINAKNYLSTNGKTYKTKEFNNLKDSLKKIITNTLDTAEIKINEIVLSDNVVNKNDSIDKINKITDSLVNYHKQKIRLLKYWKRYFKAEEKEKESFNAFPAIFASQSKRFFEGDTSHSKFFANNNINYSPISKKMVLYTEVIHDYFGPVRLDIGFTLRSASKIDTTKSIDSAKALLKKDDLVSALQNGGGDISFNVKYPLLGEVNDNNLVNLKVYSYFNVGFALPVVNEATNNFYANYDGGAEGFLFIKGFDDKITFFAQKKLAYYFGNRAFRKIIKDVNMDNPNSFFLGQASLGLDFMDGFRFKVDFYYGNSFVKNNFPTTLTFTVRPDFKNQNKCEKICQLKTVVNSYL